MQTVTGRRSRGDRSRAAAVRAVLLVLAALVVRVSAADELQPLERKATEDTWQVIYIGEQRIGYSHSTVRHLERDGRTVVRTRNEMKMQIKRFGQSLKMETLLETDETPDGDLISLTMQMKNPPAGTSRTAGRVEGGELVLERTEAGRTTKKTIPWDNAVKSPAWQDRTLRDDPLKAGESRSFKTFMPEFDKIATVRILADQPRLTKLHDGESRQLLQVGITQSVLPGMTIRGYVDETGEMLKTEMPLLGQTMTTYTVPAAVALEEIVEGGELDLAINTLVPVERIRDAHDRRRITYRITATEEDPARHVVAGGNQTVNSIDASTAEVTVQAVPIPDTTRSRQAAPPEYLAATEFLQATDRRVVDHARRAAAGDTDPADVARRMERYVHEKLSKKNFSTALASAAEVAENLEGDCTEHAVLLAAMLRAQKIPSRIAVGLVYVEGLSSFGGHMWTEALLGDTWVPLDATLGQGGIGAAHIKLAESSFGDDGPAPVTAFLPLLKILGQMQIEVVRAE